MYVLYSNYAENLPIILELFLMLLFTYYAENYASIIRPSLTPAMNARYGDYVIERIAHDSSD